MTRATRVVGDRKIVFHRNADASACWCPPLGDWPIEIRNGRGRVGERLFEGPAVGACRIRIRMDSPDALAGAVA